MGKIAQTIMKGRQKIITNRMHIQYFPVPYIIQGKEGMVKLVKAMDQMYLSKLFILADKEVLEKDLLTPLFYELEKENIEYYVYTEEYKQIEEKTVEKIYERAKKQEVDGILAVGGREILDTGKIISFRLQNPKLAYHQFHSIANHVGMRSIKKGLPLFVVPTKNGGGSEVNPNGYVYQERKRKQIKVYSNKYLPKWIAYDSKILGEIEEKRGRYECFRGLIYSIESYISTGATPKSKKYALGALKDYLNYGIKGIENPKDEEINLILANGCLKSGLAHRISGEGYGGVIGRVLGGYYGKGEEEILGVLCGDILEFYYEEEIEGMRNLELAIEIEEGKEGGENRIILEKVRGMQKRLGVPVTIWGMKEKEIKGHSKKIIKEMRRQGTVPKVIEKESCERLLRKATEEGSRWIRKE